MRPKPITKYLVHTAAYPMSAVGHCKTVKCGWCKKPFELLSDQWAYKAIVKGKTIYFCRYKHDLEWHAANDKPKPLRGEYFVDHQYINELNYDKNVKERKTHEQF